MQYTVKQTDILLTFCIVDFCIVDIQNSIIYHKPEQIVHVLDCQIIMPPKVDMDKFDKLLNAFLEVAQKDIGIVKDEINGIKAVNKELTDSVGQLVTENIDLVKSIESMKQRMQLYEGLNAQLKAKVKEQGEQIIELKARSMRENLVVNGIPEKANETWQDTKKNLQNFFEKELRIDPETIEIDRAHRIGQKNDKGGRPIVVKLSNQASRDTVFNHVKNHLPRESQFKVNEQLPPEITERRKRLWSKFKEAKQNKTNRVSWSMDKLYINGKCHTAFDDDVEINHVDLETDIAIKHTEHSNVDGSTFMGHCAQITAKEDIASVMAKLLQDRSIATATHNIYAYRYKDGNAIKEGLKDDGEHGAGHHILKALRDQNVENCIIIVSRWYGGQHLGPQRFTCISDCAKNAIRLVNVE